MAFNFRLCLMLVFVTVVPFVSAQAGQLFPPVLSDPANNNACNNHQVLGWTTNGTVKCIDPSSGVTVAACPLGTVPTGAIINGNPGCVNVPVANAKALYMSNFSATGYQNINNYLGIGLAALSGTVRANVANDCTLQNETDAVHLGNYQTKSECILTYCAGAIGPSPVMGQVIGDCIEGDGNANCATGASLNVDCMYAQ